MESIENHDADKPLSRQFSSSQTQMASTETCDKTVNKNIEDLKKLQKSYKTFNEIYDTLNRISTESDFDAINFAVKEKLFEVKNRYGETIFDRSVVECNFQLARLIIEFSHNNKYSYINSKDFNIFILKIQNFDVNEALIWASRKGHHEVVKLLLTVPGIDINAKDNYNKTALILASEEGHHEVVKLLLAVPGIDANAKDSENKTALICASRKGHHEVVKHLLTVPGIDVNAKGSENKTALIFASMCGRHEVVKLLLTVPGIDVNAKNKDKDTALIWALIEGHYEVVKLLLAVPGIDINEKDIDLLNYYKN